MQTSGKTVLIVDDNFDFADTVANLLQHYGFVTRIATSRRDALVYVGDGDFTFCLLDFMMDGMSPKEFVAATRSRCPNIYFILMSGIEDIYEEASKLGITTVLPKTSGIEMIVSTLDRIRSAKFPSSSDSGQIEIWHSNS